MDAGARHLFGDGRGEGGYVIHVFSDVVAEVMGYA